MEIDMTKLTNYLAARNALGVNANSAYFAARDGYVAARAAYAAAKAAVLYAHAAFKAAISADAGISDARKAYDAADAALRAAREDYDVAHDGYCDANTRFIKGVARDANYAAYVVARDAYDATC